MITNGYLKYVSKEPVHQKPAIFTSGGYSVETKDKKTVVFDWLDMYANTEILEDGRIKIEVERQNFDSEFTATSNDMLIDTLTPNQSTSMTLEEVFYECFKDENEQEPMDLDLIEFSVEDESGNTFTFQDIDQYNKNNS